MNSIYLISIIVSIISLNNANLNEKLQQFQQVTNALNFNGKVVLITGSGTGIGAETARLFCYFGAQVVITNIEPNSVKQIADECQQLSPNKLRALEVVADLTKEEDTRRLTDETIKHFGKIDVLINNAGTNIPAPISDKNYLPAFDKIMNINLKAPLRLINLLAPYLKITNGSIINVGSISARIPFPNVSNYVATKAALVAVSRTLAVELGPNIRVNSVSPGFTQSGSPLAKFLPPGFFEKLQSKTPLGRLGTTLDSAKAIVFFASSLAQWITGQNLDVDGGFYGDFGTN